MTSCPGVWLKKMGHKRKQICLHMFTLEDDLIKVYADFAEFYSKSCVSHCVVCRCNGGNINKKERHRLCHPITVWSEQTLLWVKKETGEDPYSNIYLKYLQCLTYLGGTIERILHNYFSCNQYLQEYLLAKDQR